MRRSVKEYLWSDELFPSEISAIQSVPDIKDKPILDVGVGTGRTTGALIKLSKHYLGIDYVDEMLHACKFKFPEVRFELADARNLSAHADESFYSIFFSSSGICMVTHDDRMQIIKEIVRLLEPGGVFMFSAYNHNFIKHAKLFYFPNFQKTLNPVKILVRGIRYIKNLSVSIINRVRYKRLEVKASDYAIINDRCHNYATMLYYSTQANIEKQLRESGLTGVLSAYGINGEKISDPNAIDDIIFYVVRKQ